jgi:methionyl-tRNA formyltransferase
MRILFFGNNWLGWQTARWLVGQGETIVGAVIHPASRRRYGDELLATLRLPAAAVVEASALADAATVRALADLRPDIGVSAMFGYVLKPDVLGVAPRGCINVHLSYLPFNRGAYPNVWSIVDRTPAGVSMHYMDAGIDTGDVVARREVPVTSWDTGETLYRRLEREALALVEETWPSIRSGDACRVAQDPLAGTSHRTREVDTIDAIDLDRPYTARSLIDILRARTFPPHAGAYFEDGGRRVYLRLQLLTEDDLEAEQARRDSRAD